MKNLNSKCGRTLSRFSIRKCSVGTASFLIGTVAFFGIHHEAFAAENSKTPVPVTQLLENSNKESTEEKLTYKPMRMKHYREEYQIIH